jgi:molybdenum cofactor guanylyltransferase
MDSGNNAPENADKQRLSCEIFILAGGQSSRMGKDKAKLVLGKRTLLGHVITTAKALNYPVHTVGKDLIPGLGPLGGIQTALQTAKSDWGLFLSCDMPFVPEKLLRRLIHSVAPTDAAAGVIYDNVYGFPFMIQRSYLPKVIQLIENQDLSLQSLANALNTKALHPDSSEVIRLLNINTPDDWKTARQLWKLIHTEGKNQKGNAFDWKQ